MKAVEYYECHDCGAKPFQNNKNKPKLSDLVKYIGIYQEMSGKSGYRFIEHALTSTSDTEIDHWINMAVSDNDIEAASLCSMILAMTAEERREIWESVQ